MIAVYLHINNETSGIECRVSTSLDERILFCFTSHQYPRTPGKIVSHHMVIDIHSGWKEEVYYLQPTNFRHSALNFTF